MVGTAASAAWTGELDVGADAVDVIGAAVEAGAVGAEAGAVGVEPGWVGTDEDTSTAGAAPAAALAMEDGAENGLLAGREAGTAALSSCSRVSSRAEIFANSARSDRISCSRVSSVAAVAAVCAPADRTEITGTSARKARVIKSFNKTISRPGEGPTGELDQQKELTLPSVKKP